MPHGRSLGSLRCDCGEQLRTAVERIGALGGGVLLYLDQEGRGIGLPNKLRAYVLQDGGLDTVDADQHLGFLADERSYDVAAALLTELGFNRIRLLTNNPQKINSLRDHGIEVVGTHAARRRRATRTTSATCARSTSAPDTWTSPRNPAASNSSARRANTAPRTDHAQHGGRNATFAALNAVQIAEELLV